MPLVNLTTNLKSLRYGKDGFHTEYLGYVTRAIPNSLDDVGRTGGPDFLLRGGTLLPRRIGNDVSRLAQMFFDFKSPAGPLFIAKQNVLSLTNVNGEAGFADPARLIMNQGVYISLQQQYVLDVFTLKFTVFPFDNLNPLQPIAKTISIIAPNFINLFSDINSVPFGNSISAPPTFFLAFPDNQPPSVSPLICSETSSSQLIKFSMVVVLLRR